MEDTGSLLLEVQVSAHGVCVTGRRPVQAAVHRWLRFQQTVQSITHVAGVAHTAPCVRPSVEAVGVLTAAATVAILTGVAGPAAPAITLVVWPAGAGDRCAHLAAVGVLAAAATPILAQVHHCACAAVPFVAQAALTAVASAAHGLGCAGWSAHRLQLQLHLTAWPRPALITEAGAGAPQALITAAMGGTVAGLAQGPEGSRGTELTGCSGEMRVAPALPAAAHAVHARAAVVTGAAGAARASSALAAVVARAAAGLPGGGDTVAVAAPAQASGLAPVARPRPHTAQGQRVQRRGCPELGEVAPAGLGAALLL